ncbi:hypothetical protein SLEP1_g13332 [Rubroshorea leprosula]|uniref:Uncharacterized protein n=1 Tax=Rubroshorea leprosula TaxID=152421 RepID=A0AAV5INI3_9ROSI|nr:hypothetical protein SLEP1_g13332 [Rubroshorea leprosula]
MLQQNFVLTRMQSNSFLVWTNCRSRCYCKLQTPMLARL